MLASKAQIQERYSKFEVKPDAFGRLISVGRLRFSERLSVRRMAETDDNLSLAYLSAAAAVRKIDDFAITFPKNLAELNSTIDILDEEGMAAAMEAFLAIGSGEEAGAEDAAKK